MTSPAYVSDMIRPLALPQFTLLLGGIDTIPLMKAISAPNPNCIGTNLHGLAGIPGTIAAAYKGLSIGNSAVELLSPIASGIPLNDFLRDADDWLTDELGESYAATSFINAFDAELVDTTADYIFTDASYHDVEPFLSKFSRACVQLITTKRLYFGSDGTKILHLDTPDMGKRLDLIIKHIGHEDQNATGKSTW